MSYDDWKCTPPEVDSDDEPQTGNEELDHLYREVARLKEENATLRDKLKQCPEQGGNRPEWWPRGV